MRVSSADRFKAGVARQRADPISLGISPRACTIPSKLLLLLKKTPLRSGEGRRRARAVSGDPVGGRCRVLAELAAGGRVVKP